MKNEISWIGLWIFTCLAMSVLSLTYFYLNNELDKHLFSILTITLISILVPYVVWKYKQIKFVEKRAITIQILQD